MFGNYEAAAQHAAATQKLSNGRDAIYGEAFQKIIQRPELTVGDPIGALARLGLGRALSESGDQDGAKAAYASLFALWQNADPGLPVVKAARAEQERLTH